MYRTLAWNKIYDNGLSIIGIFNKSNEIIGSFNLYYGTKLSQRYIITPPYATDIGLWYKDHSNTTFQKNKLLKNILKAIADFLSDQKVMFIDIVLPKNIKDAQPFLWEKFECSPKFTYILDLHQPSGVMLENMSPERRKNIRDGEKNVELFQCNDFQLAFDKIICSLSENNAHFNKLIVKNIVTEFPKESNHICIGTKTNNVLSSIHFITCDATNANYIFGWNDKTSSSIAGTYGLWSCVIEAQNRGLETFNFAGSAIPTIEKYFRGFGGELVPELNVKSASYIGKKLIQLKR